MSYTTLYSIEGGTCRTVEEYRNSHGFAPHIWDVMVAKFVTRGRPLRRPGEEFSIDTLMSTRGWLTDSTVFTELNERINRGEIGPVYATAYSLTLDRRAVKREHLQAVSAQLAAFDQANPTTERVNHLAEIAEDLARLAEDEDCEGACFYVTSLSEDLWHDWDGDAEESIPYDFKTRTDHVWVTPDGEVSAAKLAASSDSDQTTRP